MNVRTRASTTLAAPAVTQIGKNIEASVDGNILTLRIDLSARHGDSASGKTVIVATSGGNQAIEGGKGVILGLNAYIRRPGS